MSATTQIKVHVKAILLQVKNKHPERIPFHVVGIFRAFFS